MPGPGANPRLPCHVAIVMDGNGRWARRRAMPRDLGHRQGHQAARRIVERCGELGIEVLTLFAFSSENWRRPVGEVGALMGLLLESLGSQVQELHDKRVRLRFIGDRSGFSAELQQRMRDAEELTQGNEGLKLVIALGYGGRWDVVQAAQRVAEQARVGTLAPAAIDERVFAANLSLAGLPEPDLLIRTGGEQRISNFLIWDLAYTELFFSEALWPDFDPAALDAALDWFATRERRFGGVTESA